MTNDINLALDENPFLTEHPVDEPTTQEDVETPNQEDESQYLITLDRRKFNEELNNLLSNEPEFRNAFNREVGNSAARKYQPQIRKQEADLDTYRALLRREQFGKLSEEEVNERFKSDPQFAEAYTQAVHFQGQEPNIEDNRQAIASMVLTGIRNIVTAGVRQGLNQEDLITLDADLKAGKFDKDELGENLPPEMWQDMLDNLQNAVMEKVISKRIPVVENNPPPHADTARPDMSQGGSRGVRTTSITMRDFRNLSWEEQMRMFPNEGDVEKAVADGRIIVEGLER